jgi:hypothetical protein
MHRGRASEAAALSRSGTLRLTSELKCDLRRPPSSETVLPRFPMTMVRRSRLAMGGLAVMKHEDTGRDLQSGSRVSAGDSKARCGCGRPAMAPPWP